MKTNRRKVTNACERCRKQKLKCDIERPCTLCSRANTECIASGSARWRPYQGAPEHAAATNSSVKNEPGTNIGSAVESAWNSSSTVKLVEEAFQQHGSASPRGVEFSALKSETWTQSEATAEDFTTNIVETNVTERPGDIQPRQSNIRSKLSAAEKELMSLLPGIGPATLLVDNYFERIHWFILVFHQDDFRSKFQGLYDHTTVTSGPNASSRGIGFVAVLLAVFATSLHHIGAQESKLKSYNIDPEQLKIRILDTLKSRYLDIISRGSLEAVQFCVLLASYYLYHGEPEMAWPLSGSGLRIAQALSLHRKIPPGDPSDQVLKQQIQVRKRAWWAVYEIDTFCSMLYGFPLGFSDSDCNVDPLDSYDEYSGSTKGSRHPRGPSLLFYKCSMSRLSSIIKSALLELYGTRHGDRKKGGNVNGLSDKVATLNGRLQQWRRSLARKLIFDGYPSSEFQAPHGRERTGREFENYLFRLQALSLKLAYENAKILIHRPLLSFRKTNTPSMTDPFRAAMQECKEASLSISRAASTPYLLEASETYAIAVVSLHLLTAGMTLCISITLDPLAPDSAEVRSRIRQLMQVQTLLKDKSIVSAQSLDITKRLASLVMAKTGNERSETGGLSSAYPEVPEEDQSRSNLKVSGSNLKMSGWGCSAEGLMSEAKVDLKAAHATNNGSISDTLSMNFADQDMGVSADTSLNDMLLEYEQAASRLFTGDITYDPGDSILDNPLLEQNQGWIWSWNFLE